MLSSRKISLAMFFAGLTLSGGFISCSKEEKKADAPASGTQSSSSQTASNAAAAAKPMQASEFTGTLLSLVPKNAVGFIVADVKHPAYVKYKNSPWGGSSQLTKMINDSNPEAKAINDMLARLGFDPKDKNTFEKLMTEMVIFVAPPVEGDSKPAIGAVFKPDPSYPLGTFVSKVKSEVATAGGSLKAEDATIQGGTALRLEDTSDGGTKSNPMKEFYLAQKDNKLGVIGTSKKLVESLLAAAPGAVPDVLQGANFQAATVGLPSSSSRFATAFIDVEKITQLADKFNDPELAAKMKATGPLPVKALAIAVSMEEAPHTDIRLIYDESSPQNKELLATLASSPSGEILAALPSKPLFFLSLDGKTLQNAKEKLVAAAGEQAAPFKAQLDALNGITRLGIAAKSSQPGQSMLPIPEVIIVAETKEPGKLGQALEGLLGPVVASGMPGMEWKSTSENGVAIRSLQSPMGMGAFIASSKNLLIVASTDGQMKGALANVSGKSTGFSKELVNSSAERVLAKDSTVGNLYVNFGEVATALESVGGMLSMFAPQGQDAQQLLSPENLDALRKMGTVVGAVTMDPGAINIRSFYQGGA